MSRIRSKQSLFDAALESARIFNAVASECAVTGGILEAAHDFSTAGELAVRMRFHPAKAESFRALLEILVDTNLLERREGDGCRIYRTRRDLIGTLKSLNGELSRYIPRYEILEPWFGERHIERIRSSNSELLGKDLSFFRSPSVKIRFDRTFLNAWQTNLRNPLYEFGRLLAIQELVRRGRRFLDLASGLGYCSQRLAEFSEPGCEIVCVDCSQDMLDEARLLQYPGAKVRFILHDLNRGLPRLRPAFFDGIMFNGAFHFISDKSARLREMYRVLRPGGLLVIGHCFSRSGFADEPMHDFYFSMIENATWPIRFDELRSMIADAGFREIEQYHRGSHSYLLAEREQGRQ